MMLVPTRVAPSSIHGLGLFTMQFIAKGTPLWRFEEGFDRAFTTAQFEALPRSAQEHLRWFAYFDAIRGTWILSGDHTCFMNHSVEPNTGAPPDTGTPVMTVALRNIAAGEELTCDYFAFDREARQKLSGD
jgi:uncharacterized protein